MITESMMEKVVAIGKPYGGRAGLAVIADLPVELVEKAKKYTKMHRSGVIVCCAKHDVAILENLLEHVAGIVWCCVPEFQDLVEAVHPNYSVVAVDGYLGTSQRTKTIIERDSYPIMARQIRMAALESAVLPTNTLPEGK